MKNLKKITSLLLSAIMLSTLFINVAFAAESSNKVDIVALNAVVQEYTPNINSAARSTTFSDATIDVTFSSSGMSITISTSTTMIASVVGVKDIEIQLKSGSDWVTVATSTGGELKDTLGCAVTLTYTGAIYGEYYRVVCTHYGDVDGYRELYHESAAMRCIY
ncbi:MAG: hypothetical protein IJZ34_02440 [Lachnospiraceae bacterium]|nr:hypothetical protein [Lachnospiraceae bacterium]